MCIRDRLLGALLKEARFTEIVGVDVSMRALNEAARRLRLDRPGPDRPGLGTGSAERQSSARLKLTQGALTYTDSRLAGYDAAVLSEVIEHVDPPRLPALEHAVFGAARPKAVVVTTPNVEYNVRWETLPAGRMRHGDHRDLHTAYRRQRQMCIRDRSSRSLRAASLSARIDTSTPTISVNRASFSSAPSNWP